MTQQILADKLGVTNKAISKWETGEGYPEITIIPDLANELGVSVDELLTASLDETTDTYMASLIPLNQRYGALIKFMRLNSIALAFILIGLGAFVYFHTWSWHLALVGFVIMFIMSISSIFILSAAFNGIKNIKLENPDLSLTDETSQMSRKIRQMFLYRITCVIIFIAATIPVAPTIFANPYTAGTTYLFWLLISSICALIILFVTYKNVKVPNV
jgi:transcriptional regulator with XRE-family HTH domain